MPAEASTETLPSPLAVVSAEAKNVLFWDPLGCAPRLTVPLALLAEALEVIWYPPWVWLLVGVLG